MRTSRRRHAVRPGLTLIELLAVIVIVAATAGALAAGFSSRGGDARLREVAAEWSDLDARARLLAQTRLDDEGGAAPRAIVMEVDADGRAIFLADQRGGRLGSAMIPDGVEVRLALVRGGAPEPVIFDALGRSADYEVEIIGARRTLRYRVAGLTGLVREAPP